MFNIIGRIVQALLLLSVVILGYFSNKRMGVSRFLSYENMKFEKGIFQNSNLKVYSILLIILLIIMLVFLISSLMKRVFKISKINFIVLIVFILIAIMLILFKDIINLKTYYFWLIAIFLSLAIEILLMGTSILKRKS